MSIRLAAVQWFRSRHRIDNSKVYSSKYYLPEESWPKTHVWWFVIPLEVLDSSKENYINFICQTEPKGNDFHYLKIPIKFLRDHLNKFDIVQNTKIHLYLSADPDKLFLEERGTGKLDFSKFLVDSPMLS